jgi:hypothetical protein
MSYLCQAGKTNSIPDKLPHLIVKRAIRDDSPLGENKL